MGFLIEMMSLFVIIGIIFVVDDDEEIDWCDFV